MPTVRSELIEVYVFRENNASREYLLLQRSAEDTLYPGLWQVVTGTLQKNETAYDGAIREFREETGFKAYKNVWCVPLVNSFYDIRNDVVQLVPLFAIEVHSDVEPVLSREHQAFRWVSYDDAESLLAWPTQRFGLQVVHRFIGTHERASQMSHIL